MDMLKKDIIAKTKNILHKYKLYETLNNLDFKYILTLINNHPRAKEKIGIGISAIKIIPSRFKKPQFQIIRKDNSTTDFSYLKCLNSNIYKTSHLLNVKKACREAISKDMLLFKQEQFKDYQQIICPITNKSISFYDSHVDHTPPNTFESIFNNWLSLTLKSNNNNIEDLKLIGYNDNEDFKNFKDKSISNSFREYHNKVAKLRILSIEANLKQKKR